MNKNRHILFYFFNICNNFSTILMLYLISNRCLYMDWIFDSVSASVSQEPMKSFRIPFALFARRRWRTRKEEKEISKACWSTLLLIVCARKNRGPFLGSREGPGVMALPVAHREDLSGMPVLSSVLITRPGHRRLYIKENNHRNRA